MDQRWFNVAENRPGRLRGLTTLLHSYSRTAAKSGYLLNIRVNLGRAPIKSSWFLLRKKGRRGTRVICRQLLTLTSPLLCAANRFRVFDWAHSRIMYVRGENICCVCFVFICKIYCLVSKWLCPYIRRRLGVIFMTFAMGIFFKVIEFLHAYNMLLNWY